MKIGKFPFRARQTLTGVGRLTGLITMPAAAKIIYIAAQPPKGEMFVWAEVREVMGEQLQQKEYVILQEGDSIPDGYVYVATIVAVPFLFIYEHISEGEISNG